MTKQFATPLEAGLDLAAKGYPVFPTTPDGKEPTVQGGFYAAVTERAKIEAWINDPGRRGHGLAIATGAISGVIVIDADDAEARERMRAKYGEPTALSAHDHKGGGHWYFRHPRNGKVGSSPVGPGLDRKGDGGYVLVPPSKNKTWVNGVPEIAALPVLPAEFWGKEDRTEPLAGDEISPAQFGAGAEKIAEHYAIPGERYEFGRHLSGLLMGNGIGEKDAARLQLAALQHIGGVDSKTEYNIGRVIKTTADRIARGENVTGGPHVEEYASKPGLVDALKDIFGWGPKSVTVPKISRGPRLEQAYEPQQGGFLAHRTKLGHLIEEGIPEPTFLYQDVLVEGMIHHIFAAAEQGKTFLSLSIMLDIIKRGLNVVYLDKENGARIFGDRLQTLQADTTLLDQYLYYFTGIPMPFEQKAVEEFLTAMEEIKPDLVIFDSLIGFLSSAGIGENENTEVELWANTYCSPLRDMGIATILLDHVPHNARRARGASRKTDFVDIQWHLIKSEEFSRDTVGEVKLSREKDRISAVPKDVKFTIGGSQNGFVFRRSDGMALEDGRRLEIADGTKKSAEALKYFGSRGALTGEWIDKARELGVGRSQHYEHRKTLQDRAVALHRGDRYYWHSFYNSEPVRSNPAAPDAKPDGFPGRTPTGHGGAENGETPHRNGHNGASGFATGHESDNRTESVVRSLGTPIGTETGQTGLAEGGIDKEPTANGHDDARGLALALRRLLVAPVAAQYGLHILTKKSSPTFTIEDLGLEAVDEPGEDEELVTESRTFEHEGRTVHYHRDGPGGDDA